jgi:dolichyl-diphosphooligosaccharide--protein glycosyltransferase
MPPKPSKTPPRVASTPAVPKAAPVKLEPVVTTDGLAAVDVQEDSTTGPNSIDPLTGRKLAYPIPQHISTTTIDNAQSLLRIVIIGLICAAAIGSRLFAVIRFESVIHEL